jgi:hypothetical protein
MSDLKTVSIHLGNDLCHSIEGPYAAEQPELLVVLSVADEDDDGADR